MIFVLAAIYATIFYFLSIYVRKTKIINKYFWIIGIPTLLPTIFSIIPATNHYLALILLLCPLGDFFLVKKPTVGVLLYSICYLTISMFVCIPLLSITSHISIKLLIAAIIIAISILVIIPTLPKNIKLLFALYAVIILCPLLFSGLVLFNRPISIAFILMFISDFFIGLNPKTNNKLYDCISLISYWSAIFIVAFSI